MARVFTSQKRLTVDGRIGKIVTHPRFSEVLADQVETKCHPEPEPVVPMEVVANWLRRKARLGRPVVISSLLALRIAAALERAQNT